MRVVNLSRRPFLNRRPVARVAVMMWILGALLLTLNAWLYAGYFSGTTENRERLAKLNAEIDGAEREFDAVGQRLSQVALGERNQRAAFLNDLIDQRTFPWSRLFDDLEDALHKDIYLTLVAPSVDSEEPKSSRRTTPNRRMTPRQARERARQQQRRGDGTSSSMPTPESANVEAESDVEVVTLNLQGVARTDEALLDFVDELYRYDSFVDPFLSFESRDDKSRGINFSIDVYYLLPRRTAGPIDDEDVAGNSSTDSAEAVAATSDPNDGDDAGDGDVPVVEVDAARGRTVVPDDENASGSPRRPGIASAQPELSEARGEDPRVSTPGTTRDRSREEARDRQAVEEELRQLQDRNDRRRPASRGGLSVDDKGREPELTEPSASASPALRRLGALTPVINPTVPPTRSPTQSPTQSPIQSTARPAAQVATEEARS